MNINLPGIITLLVVFLNIFFLKFLFEQKKGNKTTKGYLVTVITIIISWQIFVLLNRIFDLGDYSVFIWRIAYGLLTFGAFYPLLFFASFLKIKIKKSYKIAIYSLASLVSIIAIFTNLMIPDTELFWWGREAVMGQYYFVTPVTLVATLVVIIVLLVHGYIKSKDKDFKRSIIIILIGFSINIAIGLFFDNISNITGEPFPALTGVASSVMNLAILIAIYKFSFMEVRPRRFTIGQKLFFSFTVISFIVVSSLSYVTFSVGKQILEERPETYTDITQFTEEQTARLRDSITVISFVILLLIIFFTIFLGRRITRRINDLRQAAIKISKGDLNTKIKVVLKDEIGDLASAFNLMTKNLKEAKEEIDVYNRTLETKVDERTKQLKREQEKLKITLESIGDAALVIDKDGSISLFNKMAEKMTLLRSSRALGKKYQDIVNLQDEKNQKENYEFIENALNKHKITHIKIPTVLVNKKGDEIPVLASASPIYDPLKRKVDSAIVTIRDISAQREIDKMKDDFISLVSHQLRTPLTVIKWSLESFMSLNKEDNKKLEQKQITSLYEATLRMNKLINMILNISRIESGNLLVKPEDVDVVREAKAVIDELETLLTKKNQKIKLNVIQSISKIKTDQRLLKEIISNLVSNAIKYTHVGGHIEINISQKEKYILTEVKDNGIGIPEKAQSRIFQRFFRAINAIRTENVGTGLGLAIIKNLVEMLGGKIWFTSKENKGTSFFFRLPLSGVKERKGGKGLA